MRRAGPQVALEEEVAGESVRTPPRGMSCEGCSELFVPGRASQRYCRPACRPLAQRHRQAERLSQLLERVLPDDPGRAE